MFAHYIDFPIGMSWNFLTYFIRKNQKFLSTAFISPIRKVVPQKQNVKYILSEPSPTHLFVKMVLLLICI